MPLIRHGALVDDSWLSLDDDDQPESGRPVIVSLSRWRLDRERLLAHDAPLGLRLLPDEVPGSVAGDLPQFRLIALVFPRFGDGRPYSYARLLRERYGFTGELRAVGDVLRDQLMFMQRCGFDSFEVSEELAKGDWQSALSEISVSYQPTADGRRSAIALRHGRASSPG